VFNDSKALQTFVQNVLSKAHITVGQNIDSFDFKVLNDRLCLLGLPPFDSELSIDILKQGRKSFKMPSQKLDFRSERHGHGGKQSIDMQDWIDVAEGKVPAEEKIVPYGCKDVDDEQSILYDEFDYYKNLPAKVEKLIYDFAHPNKPQRYCVKCSKNHRPKFDILYDQQSKIYFCEHCQSENIKTIKQ
jgi:hypothetical protein